LFYSNGIFYSSYECLNNYSQCTKLDPSIDEIPAYYSYNNTNITGIIAEGVTTIGKSAFYWGGSISLSGNIVYLELRNVTRIGLLIIVLQN